MTKTLIKRFTSILLGGTLLFSTSYSAFATAISENSEIIQTTEEYVYEVDYRKYYVSLLPKPTELPTELATRIKEDYLNLKISINEKYNRYTADDVMLIYYGATEDGGLLLHNEFYGTYHTEAIEFTPLNDYVYVSSSGGEDITLYKDNKFYPLEDIFYDSDVSNDYKAEIASVLNLQKVYQGGATRTELKEYGANVINPSVEYTPTSIKRYNTAYQNAVSVAENPESTKKDIDEAYIDIKNACYALQICTLNLEKARLCCEYADVILNNYLDYFSAESTANLSEYKVITEWEIYYCHSQREIDEDTQILEECLLNLEQIIENTDIIPFDEVLKINELMENYKAQISNEMGEFSFAKMPHYKDFNGYKLVGGSYDFVLPMPTSERIGDYILEKNNIYAPSEYGYFAVNAETSDILTLEEVIEKGVVELDKLFELENEVNFGFDMYLIGDVNYDGYVNVVDATSIQKVSLALAKQDDRELTTDTVYDYNEDGRVSILDTTEVQKTIANIK